MATQYRCHECGQSFSVTDGNEFGTYEFRRCPNCGGSKTTLAG